MSCQPIHTSAPLIKNIEAKIICKCMKVYYVKWKLKHEPLKDAEETNSQEGRYVFEKILISKVKFNKIKTKQYLVPCSQSANKVKFSSYIKNIKTLEVVH